MVLRSSKCELFLHRCKGKQKIIWFMFSTLNVHDATEIRAVLNGAPCRFYICLSYFRIVVSIILRVNYVHRTIKSFPGPVLQHLCVSTTGHKQRGPMTNTWPPARPRAPPGGTGHSGLRLPLGSPFITTCPSALFSPARPAAAPWINRGHVWTADPRPWRWNCSNREPSMLAYQRPNIRRREKNCDLWLGESFLQLYFHLLGHNSDCSLWFTTTHTDFKEAICKNFNWKVLKWSTECEDIWHLCVMLQRYLQKVAC